LSRGGFTAEMFDRMRLDHDFRERCITRMYEEDERVEERPHEVMVDYSISRIARQHEIYKNNQHFGTLKDAIILALPEADQSLTGKVTSTLYEIAAYRRWT